MYSYGYLFYIPINIIYLLIFGIKGIIKRRKKEYYFFVLIFGIYLNFFIDKAFSLFLLMEPDTMLRLPII